MYPDSDEEMKNWMNAINKAIDRLKGPAGTPTPTNNRPLGATTKEHPSADMNAIPAGMPSAGSSAGSAVDFSGVRGRLQKGKDEISFLHVPDSKVLELWQIWMESIPPSEEILEGAAVTFEVSVSADMDKLSWRSSGPQNLFIQKMVDFFWNVGAPESEIDRLNDIGALINPSSIGSWIDMSAKGGMDGGWFFPCDIPLKFALEASDPGDPVGKVSTWTGQNNVTRCFTVGRDMGAAPPRQTEIRLELPGDFDQQLTKACNAFETFGFPPISGEYLAILRENPAESMALSVITSSEGFVRLGLLYPRPTEQMFSSIADVSNFQKFHSAFGVDGPTWVEFQFLNAGFGYGVYKEGFDVVFHYTIGAEGPQ